MFEAATSVRSQARPSARALRWRRWRRTFFAAHNAVLLLALPVTLACGVWAGLGHALQSVFLAFGFGIFAALWLRPSVVVGLGALLLCVPGFSPFGLPANEFGGVILVLGIVFCGNRGRQPRVFPPGLLATVGVLGTWVLVEWLAQHPDSDSTHRLLHLLVWLALIVALGLYGAPSAALRNGLALGIIAQVPASLLLSTGYEDRVGGLSGDPNTMSAFIVVLTPIAVAATPQRWVRGLLWAVAFADVALAQSRTGIAALLACCVGLLFFPRLRGWALGIPLVAGVVVGLAPSAVSLTETFDRGDSDELRGRIELAGEQYVAERVWAGHGLGRAKVDLGKYGVGDVQMLFHNSYTGLLAEIGLIGLIAYFAVVFGAVFRAVRSSAAGPLFGVAAGLVMATRLGEVLLDLPMAVALGLAWFGSGKLGQGGTGGAQLPKPCGAGAVRPDPGDSRVSV